jgi:Tfp pilus assembly protein PilN
MAQQINLYSPILLAPKRHFSALAMVHSLAVLAAGLVAFSLWAVSQTQGLRHSLAAAVAADTAEQQRLQAALAARPAPPSNVSALEQELTQAQRQLAEREALLAAITTPTPGSSASRSALLRLLAQTLPASAWLTEVTLVDGRIELAGATLQPETLRPWLDRLSAHPALAGQVLAAVRVERRDNTTGTTSAGGNSSGNSGNQESWAFRVASARSGAVPTTPTSPTSPTAPASPTVPGGRP